MGRCFISRRHFLLGSLAAGAGGAGYWFGRRPVRLALIGAGTQGNSLAKANRLNYWLGGLYGRSLTGRAAANSYEIVVVCHPAK